MRTPLSSLRRWRALPLLALALASCGGPGEPAAPRSYLLISVDTLRADHLGCYGYPRPTSPNIDALAREGAVFENAFSPCSWTLPSHASMLTGLYPALHGLQDDGARLGPGIPTLARSLKRLGLHTLAVVSHVYASSQFGLDRGFDAFDDSLLRGGTRNPIAEEVVDRFLERIDQAPPGPWFGFLHFFDPHWGYQPPPPFDTLFSDPGYSGPIDGTYETLLPFLKDPALSLTAADRRELIGRYDGEIAYIDSEIGRLLDGLDHRGRLEGLVVVITSDHGEEFEEHGQYGHGKTLFGEVLGIPLVVRGLPGLPPGLRSPEPVSPIDIAPTFLRLAGARSPDPPLSRPLGGAPPRDQRALFAESIRVGSEIRAVRLGRHKLIHRLAGDRRYYFDLAQDPQEQRPLPADPTGGALTDALTDYALATDRAWHLKLVATRGRQLDCRARIRTSGRILDPRPYFASNMRGRRAEIAGFDLAPDGGELRFEIHLANHMGLVVFDVDPPEAPLTLEVELTGPEGEPGLFLGGGERVAAAGPLTLQPSDPRLREHVDTASAAAGCYVRAVDPARASAPRSDLSRETLEHLRQLGYVDDGD